MNNMNYGTQNYRGLKLQLKNRVDYKSKGAKEYHIINTKGFLTDYTVWIPNSFQVNGDGTLDTNKNFMFVFTKNDVKDRIFKSGYKFTY